MLNKWKVIGMTAFMTVALAACNTESDEKTEDVTTGVQQKEAQKDDHNQEHKEEQHEEHAHEANARLVVSSNDLVYVLNEKFEAIQQFEIGQGAFSIADSGRYVFVRDAVNKDSYTLLDSGIYAEDHGDHLHSYETVPTLAATKIAADKPAHMISHANQTAIFNDGSGQVDVFDNTQLSTENFKPSFSYKGIAHHGAAVPLSTGELAVTFVKNEGDALPAGVKIVDKSGKETTLITDSCEGLHGTAYGGEGSNEKLAFGCMGKVVLYDVTTKKTVDVVLPDVNARVGTVKRIGASNYFLTNYTVEEQAQTKVGVIDSTTGELKLVELPAAYKSATLVTKEDMAYVLAEDGNIYQIDLAAASVKMTISALNPFDLAEEAPQLFAMNEHVYVMMPSFQKIYEVHGNHTDEVTKLDFVPTALAVVEVK